MIVEDGKPRLGPGSGITIDAFTKIMCLAAENQGLHNQVWVDDTTVMISPTLRVWWSPGKVRWLHFKSEEINATKQAQTPPLLWIAKGDELYIFALKKSERPTPETVLYQAPFYNVNTGGKVCLGSTPLPEGRTTQGWEAQFFASTFTHPFGQVKLCTYRGGFKALWKSLMTDATKAFPEKALVPTKYSTKQFVDSLR